MAAATLVACAAGDDPGSHPNDGLFRDFVDGKFDGAGHPFNARITPAAVLCADAGVEADDDGVVELDRPCAGAVAGGEQNGALVVNVRMRIDDVGDAQGTDPVVALRIARATGEPVVEQDVTADGVRVTGEWTDVALSYASAGWPITLAIEPADGARVSIEYAELFPARFRLVVSPGSGVIADDDAIAIELPIDEPLTRLAIDDEDVLPRLGELLDWGIATREDTAFRSIITVPAGELAPARGDVAQLRVGIDGEAARIELRRAPAACVYEGDPTGTPVLVTGFHPFPADGWHDNVSEVAVRGMRPAAVPGARVMRLILPVEYDRAAAAVRDAIARCRPEVVISFGQGGGAIALERTAYNLKDTGEVPGGVPDNRGVIAAVLSIDPAAPAERSTSLPLDDIGRALEAIDEDPEPSDDPGRYICNNVFFTTTGTVGQPLGPRRAGFIHLPYVTLFDDTIRARWARVVETAIAASL